MAKDKSVSKSTKATKAVAPAPVKDKKVSKPIDKVAAGRVTKTDAKAESKKTAKEVAKKTKKSKKEPTPEPSSDEDESSDTSVSSDSSDEESEEDTKPATNGAAKKTAAKPESESESESEMDSDESESSESESEVEKPVTKTAKANAPKANGAAKKADSSDDSDDSSDDDSDDEAPPAVNGKALAAETKQVNERAEADSSEGSSDEESDSEDDAPKLKAGGEAAAEDDDDSSDDDSSDEEDDEEEEKAQPTKKRKAEEEAEPVAKKAKSDLPEGASANLFVGNLSWNVDEEWLTREFESFGTLAGVRIITDRDSGRSKGFGYVEFTTPEEAAAALEARQGYSLDNRELRVDFSTPRDQSQKTPRDKAAGRAQAFGDVKGEPTATLFVGNLSFDVDNSAVSDMFSEYGNVMGVRLPTDRDTGNPKGFGYVEMGSVDEAKAALEALQGGELAGRPMRLDYSSPRPQNDAAGGRGGRGGGRGGRGGFGDRGGRGGRGGGRGGFGDRGGRGGRGGGSTNRGGFGDFSGRKTTF